MNELELVKLCDRLSDRTDMLLRRHKRHGFDPVLNPVEDTFYQRAHMTFKALELDRAGYFDTATHIQHCIDDLGSILKEQP
jgi:hypothetical protein